MTTSAIPRETIRRALNVRRSYIRACNRQPEATTPRIVRTVADQYRISTEQVFAYLVVASRVKNERVTERRTAQTSSEMGAMMRQNRGTL